MRDPRNRHETGRRLRRRTDRIRVLCRRLRTDAMSSARLLAEMTEAHCPLLKHHAADVSLLSVRIAARLGLTDRQRFALTLAATVHDVGKIRVDAEVLEKSPRALTPAESEMIRRHPAEGASLVTRVGDFEDIPSIIRHHHERFDGAGYPDRLRGDAIPLASRIIAVADAWVNERRRRGRVGPDAAEKALDAVRARCPVHFDPDVVAELTAVLRGSDPFETDGDEIDVPLRDLREGMVLSRDLLTLRGVMLLSADSTIRRQHILAIGSHRHTDPVVERVWVHNPTVVPVESVPFPPRGAGRGRALSQS